MQSMNEAKTGRSWLTEAKQDINQWSGHRCRKMPTTSLSTGSGSHPSTWNTALEPQQSQDIDLIAVLDAADTALLPTPEITDSMQDSSLSAQQLHNLLKKDLTVRDRLESIIAQCNTAFMTDFDRLIASYRLPRALAYANRRLCDEIAMLRRIGVAMGLWTIAEERRERVTVPVLQPVVGAGNRVNFDDIQDRTAQIVNGRAERRAARA